MTFTSVFADNGPDPDSLRSETTVDLRFEISGSRLPAERRTCVAQAVLGHLPWLADDPRCGIHPVRGAIMEGGALGISRRARLALRLPRARVDDARALEGCILKLGADSLGVRHATVWPITATATLYAPLVVLGPEDEAGFLGRVVALLDALRIACDRVIGRRGAVVTPQGERAGYSLLLHGMQPRQSLLLQEQGLGEHRLYGCGIMTPHKSIAAV